MPRLGRWEDLAGPLWSPDGRVLALTASPATESRDEAGYLQFACDVWLVRRVQRRVSGLVPGRAVALLAGR